MNTLAYPLSAPLSRGPYADRDAWSTFLARCPLHGHVERGLWSGFHADRLAYAFVGGYRAALAALFDHAARSAGIAPGGAFPELPLPLRLSLCATEAGGAHPRKIVTRLDKKGGALVLNGEKTFATLADTADELLVVASRGLEADGRNRLRLVRVKPNVRGVEIIAKPPLPFTPELSHAVVRFVDVIVEDGDVLPGDGYDGYMKPFRTIEDTHVLAATIGYLLGAARAHGFDRAITAELASMGAGVIDVAARDPGAALTHVVLAGLFGMLRRLTTSLVAEWDRAPDDERMRWRRDLPLLFVAEGVRSKRTEAAWRALGTEPPKPLRV